MEYEDALFFKENKKSCKDKSSLRNAEAYGHKKRRKFTFNCHISSNLAQP